MVSILRDQFRNDSGGVAGVVTVTARGDMEAIALRPGDMVWLSEEEQALTATAPRNEEDNPFINGTLTLLAEAADIKHARPLRPVEQEVGAAPVASGEPPQGTRAPGEEVATPEAVPSEPEVEVAADGKHIVKKADTSEPTRPARRPAPQAS